MKNNIKRILAMLLALMLVSAMTVGFVAYADEPVAEHLPAFEKRLAEAIIEVQKKPLADQTLVRKISWDALGEKLCSLWAKNIS